MMEDMYSDEFIQSLGIPISFNLTKYRNEERNDTDGNTTLSPEDDMKYEKALLNYYLMGIGGTTLCAVGIVCNILSVIVLTRRVMNSSTYSYLSALAVCDTLALVLTMIIFLLSDDTKYPENGKFVWTTPVYARLFPYLHPAAVTFQVTSIWLTLAFTVDRYIMICHPFKAERMCSVSRARKVIVGIYTLGALFNIPRFLEYTSNKIEVPSTTGGQNSILVVQYTRIGSSQLFIDMVHSYLYLTFVCGIPFLTLAVLNTFLIYAVHMSKKNGRLINAKEKKRNDTTVMLIGVIILFLVCQGPALLSRMVYAIDIKRATASMTFHKVLKVGVTCTRYVSLRHARPWVIHAYRNIKGRGLHVDEDEENVVPITKDEDSSIKVPATYVTAGKNVKAGYLYEEQHYDKIHLPSQQASTSKASEDHEVTDSKKAKLASDADKDESGKSDKDSNATSTEDQAKIDEGKIQAGTKRSLRDEGDVAEKTSEQTVETEGSESNSTEVVEIQEQSESKRRKLDVSDDDTNLDTPDKAKLVIEIIDESGGSDDEKDVAGNPESDKMCNTKNDNQEDLTEDKNVKQTEEDKTVSFKRSSRKRKKADIEVGKKATNEPAGLSTYDKVRLIIQPWRKPEGGINKDILKMMLESVMLFLMMNPGCPVSELDKRYAPYLQPMVLRNIVDMLEDIGCLTKQYMMKQKASLFSKPILPQIVPDEVEDCIMMIVPTDDCVLKMGLFGQEAFPNAKWPETCYPAIIEKRNKNK